jgi:hypothetical protein
MIRSPGFQATHIFDVLNMSRCGEVGVVEAWLVVHKRPGAQHHITMGGHPAQVLLVGVGVDHTAPPADEVVHPECSTVGDVLRVGVEH